MLRKFRFIFAALFSITCCDMVIAASTRKAKMCKRNVKLAGWIYFVLSFVVFIIVLAIIIAINTFFKRRKRHKKSGTRGHWKSTGGPSASLDSSPKQSVADWTTTQLVKSDLAKSQLPDQLIDEGECVLRKGGNDGYELVKPRPHSHAHAKTDRMSRSRSKSKSKSMSSGELRVLTAKEKSKSANAPV